MRVTRSTSKADETSRPSVAPISTAGPASAHPIFRLQRAAGNQSVLRLISPRLQPQLQVGAADDIYEREADRVADHVMRMPAPALQRKCAECEEEERDNDQGVRGDATIVGEAPPIVDEVLASPGRPLDAAVRRFMEPRFGHDFSGVQVHTGSRAAESAQAVNAVAYTVGRNIVFNDGAYQPETDSGRRLLAHELTHVIQQGHADSSIEGEADNEFGDSTTLGDPVQSYARGERRVQRQELCCCCVTSATIGNISRIDTATHMGHNFDFTISMSRATVHGPFADTECTLEWWETADVPALTGHAPNTKTNMFRLAPTSPTFDPWNNRSTDCDKNSTVTITDIPSLGRRTGRNVTRTLVFDLKVKSGTSCGCANAEQSATATQVLTMVNGAPDWANSSFTTP